MHRTQCAQSAGGWLTGVGGTRWAGLPTGANTRFREPCAFPPQSVQAFKLRPHLAIHDSRFTLLLTHPESTGHETNRRNPSHIGDSAPGIPSAASHTGHDAGSDPVPVRVSADPQPAAAAARDRVRRDPFGAGRIWGHQDHEGTEGPIDGSSAWFRSRTSEHLDAGQRFLCVGSEHGVALCSCVCMCDLHNLRLI